MAWLHALYQWARATPQPTGGMAYWIEAYGPGGRTGRPPLDIAGPDIPDVDLKHPLAPLVAAYLDAMRPGVRHASGATGIAPKQLTGSRDRRRQGQPPLFIPPPDAVLYSPARAAAMVQGELPGMVDAWDADTVIYPFWDALARAMIERAQQWTRNPKRARYDGLRAARAALYIADRPHVRRRRGRVPVDVDLADLARELWPGTPAAPSQHGAALDRTLTESDAYRVGVDGGLLFPVRRTLWTPPDAIARGAQRFDVTYGVRGGNGPAYDRWLMRDAGPEPRRFLAYLAYVSAVDRGGRVDLDALADAVSLGLAPAQRRDRRHSAIEALEWLADWRPPLLGPDGRPMLDGKGKPRPDHAAAARVVYDVTRQFGGPDRLTLRRPPALPALPASDESGP